MIPSKEDQSAIVDLLSTITQDHGGQSLSSFNLEGKVDFKGLGQYTF